MAANPRVEELRRRLEKEPGSRFFAQLAEELRKDGQLAEAIQVCRDGLQKHPLYPSARMTLGRALFDTGDLAAARAEFEQVLKAAPDNILASRFLAECLEGLGDLEGARARYRLTAMLSPGDTQVATRLASLEARAAAAQTLIRERAAVSSSAPGAEPPPIPVAADEGDFELERPFEAPATAGLEARAWPPAAPTAEVVAPQVPRAAGPAPATEPPPIPLVEAEESFELERPYEAPRPGEAPAAAARPAAAPPAEAVERVPVVEFAFEPEPEAAPAAEPGAGLASPTLGELYFEQGLPERAVDVYREIVEREPGNERARARLAELEAQINRPAGRPVAARDASAEARAARRRVVQQTIERLEGLLTSIRRA